MAEPTSELMLEILRNVQDKLATLTRRVEEGFGRLEGDNINFRYRNAALQADYDQLRADFDSLRSRVARLERQAARDE